MDFESLLDFVVRFKNSALNFASDILDFMNTTFVIDDNTYTLFELMFGGAVIVFLTTTIIKWIVGIVTWYEGFKGRFPLIYKG